MSDPATAAQVGILGGHNYGSSAAAVTQFGIARSRAALGNRALLRCQRRLSITNGLAVAEQIHDFMTVAEANAYHYWWLKGSGTGSIAGNSTTTPAKRLYVMGNYSKFVRPGFQRVTVTSNTTALISAYKNPASQDFVIVAANPTAWPVTQTFNLASCPTVTSLDRWVTSDTLSLEQPGGRQCHRRARSPPSCPPIHGHHLHVRRRHFPGDRPEDQRCLRLRPPSMPSATGTTRSLPPRRRTTPPRSMHLRTPPAAGNFTFGGHSLTLPPLAVPPLQGRQQRHHHHREPRRLTAVRSKTATATPLFTLAGTISVTANSIIYPANDATRTINIAAELDGTGALTCGNGGVGTVSFSGNNDSFTGSSHRQRRQHPESRLPVESRRQPRRLSTPDKLTLANGIFQPTASFEMNRSNGGVTLGTGGGTFSINSGLTLTVANPLTGTGNLTKTGPGSLSAERSEFPQRHDDRFRGNPHGERPQRHRRGDRGQRHDFRRHRHDRRKHHGQRHARAVTSPDSHSPAAWASAPPARCSGIWQETRWQRRPRSSLPPSASPAARRSMWCSTAPAARRISSTASGAPRDPSP